MSRPAALAAEDDVRRRNLVRMKVAATGLLLAATLGIVVIAVVFNTIRLQVLT